MSTKHFDRTKIKKAIQNFYKLIEVEVILEDYPQSILVKSAILKNYNICEIIFFDNNTIADIVNYNAIPLAVKLLTEILSYNYKFTWN